MPSGSEHLPSPDPIQRHPPERRQRQKEYVVLYSCCCCCCCCLHTLGGAIGAALGGNYSPQLGPTAPGSRRFPSSQSLYWTSLLIVFVLFLVVGAGFMALLESPSEIPEALVELSLVEVGGFILAGPLWLLAACVVTALRIALRRDLPARGEYWRSLRRIALGIFLGSLTGIGVMLPLFLLLANW